MTKVMDQFEKEVENLGAYPILRDAHDAHKPGWADAMSDMLDVYVQTCNRCTWRGR